jgi:hypothetical protein
MNIGEEQDPIEVPMPVNPRKVPIEQPIPATPATPEPATPEPARQHAESFQEWIDAGIIEVDS